MDLTTIAVGLLAAQTQSRFATAAANMLKSDFNSQNDIAQLLQSSSQSVNTAANLASHLGTNLDITA